MMRPGGGGDGMREVKRERFVDEDEREHSQQHPMRLPTAAERDESPRDQPKHLIMANNNDDRLHQRPEPSRNVVDMSGRRKSHGK